MPVRVCDMTPLYDAKVLARPPEPLQHVSHEPRYAVRRRLHDRSQNQSLLRLRPHAAGNRPLGTNAERRTARADGRAAGPHPRGRIAGAAGGRNARVSRVVEAVSIALHARCNLSPPAGRGRIASTDAIRVTGYPSNDTHHP